MKYFIDETDIEFKVGDVIEVPRFSDNVSETDFGVITEISETMWSIREQLNVYINGENMYYKHYDIVALYRKNEKGDLILLWENKLFRRDEKGELELL